MCCGSSISFIIEGDCSGPTEQRLWYYCGYQGITITTLTEHRTVTDKEIRKSDLILHFFPFYFPMKLSFLKCDLLLEMFPL